MRVLSPLALLAVLLLTGCAGLDATAPRDLDGAALDLDDQLDAPGLLAATALLYHATHDRYPATPFELLGSVEARESGLQRLGLSVLQLSPRPDGLELAYTLLPTASDPSDRYGTVTVAAAGEEGTYEVGLLLERRADPDHAARALPLTQRGRYEVVRARGTLCADVATVRDRVRDGEAAGTPPLEAGRTYTVTFTPTRGSAPELGEGYTVTLPR